MKYVIITPAKNEADYIRNTMESVTRQSLRPMQWIIVNDGSTDNTEEIIREYMKKHSWIKLLDHKNESKIREGGVKVVDVFYHGFNHISNHGYNFLAKLDADLTLPRDYFKKVAECYRDDPDVGLCGGYLINEMSGKTRRDKSAGYHLRGALKTYRKACYDDIGGLRRVYNWDGLDEMTAMHRGWKVKILDTAVVHHRQTSAKINRGIRNSYRAGEEYYRDGNSCLLSALRAVSYGLKTRPRIMSGVVFIVGFISAWTHKKEKHVDKELERFMRQFQYRRIRTYVSRRFG